MSSAYLTKKCPYCGNTLTYPDYAWTKARSGHQCRVKTICCGKVVTLKPVILIKVEESNARVDDWGNEE